MKKPALLVLASNVKKWAHLQKTIGDEYDVSVRDSVSELHHIEPDTKIVLLILSLESEPQKTLNVASISEQVGASYTLMAPPSPSRADIRQLAKILLAVVASHAVDEDKEYRFMVEGPRLKVANSENEQAAAVPAFYTKWQNFVSRITKLRERRRQKSVPRESRPPRVLTPKVSIVPAYTPLIQTQSTSYSIAQHPNSLHGFLLGQFHVCFNSVKIDSWHSRKGKSLVAYLLFHRDESNLRDVLMEQFWPGVSQESARNSLNVALHGIRKSFKKADPERDFIIFDTDRYRLNPDIPVELDCEAFMRSWTDAQRVERMHGLAKAINAYEKAAKLYRGDFIEDELFESWICSERETIKEAFLFTLDRLSAHYTTTREFPTAAALCEQILSKDDCRENVHRRLMRCYYHAGHRDMAIKQYHKCAQSLLEALDISPSQATNDLYDRIVNENFEGNDDIFLPFEKN